RLRKPLLSLSAFFNLLSRELRNELDKKLESFRNEISSPICPWNVDQHQEMNRIQLSSPVNAKALSSSLSLSAVRISSTRRKFLSVYSHCRRNNLIFSPMNITGRSYINISGSRFFAASSTASRASRQSFPLTLSASLTQSSNAPQRSEEWFALRKDKLTTSTFSTALGFWKGNRRFELWQEKVFPLETDLIIPAASRNAMQWGVKNESSAIDRYKTITGQDVSSLGFAVHSDANLDWIGASPDGLLGCVGILEVKCPYNKGKPEKGLPWSTMPFYYMPQVQGQLEIMDREWADLYCWTPNGSTIFRVPRDPGYWEVICKILEEFWWGNVVPAREALLAGREEEAKSFMPTSTHNQTGLAISRSIRLAADCKLKCREVAGHAEFFL
ncbi:hypothetical protein LINPERHAP2_LOCUS9967, partial [Linum perenne]